MAGKAAGTGKGSGKGQAEKALPKGHDSLDSANKAVGLNQRGSSGQAESMTAKRSGDFAEWYAQAVMKAGLADHAPVSGFMVIRPNGYAIWENIQGYFNKRIKALGVSNAYFPLLIPESFFKKEAQHAEGFAPELAWVEKKEGEERVAIRPTSETIIYDSYAKWIRSWRDLPLRINQWCNVLRWEVSQTKMFLRTREFLWQEGHCVYETKEECDDEVRLFLGEYRKLCEEVLAIPVIAGWKTKNETFAGALYTTTLESLMPDGKALQMATSHNLGQGFAKAFGIKFFGKDEEEHTPWQSSWGFSTRLIGALVMAHGDDKGACFPPAVAPLQVVVVPIVFDKEKKAVLEKSREIGKRLAAAGFRAYVDDRDEYSAGWKFNEWETKGVPLRVEVGPKDIEKKQAVLVKRNSGEKAFVKEAGLEGEVKSALDSIQKELFAKASKFLSDNVVEVKTYEEFKKVIAAGKMAKAYFCEDPAHEKKIKEETAAIARCIPFEHPSKTGKCFFTGKPAKRMAYFARSY